MLDLRVLVCDGDAATLGRASPGVVLIDDIDQWPSLALREEPVSRVLGFFQVCDLLTVDGLHDRAAVWIQEYTVS